MQSNSLRKKAASGPGKLIVDISKKVSLDSDMKTIIEHKLCPYFFQVFENANSSDGNTNENLYSSFYKLTEDTKLSTEIQDVLKRTSGENFRPFVGVLLHSLMRSLIKNRAELFERRKDENVKPLDNNDQLVIFYISGYIIHTLTRKCLKANSKSVKLQALQEAMRLLLKNESDSEKTFVNKYSEWTYKTNRGGLKIPSDSFFLLIRECEMCCRDEIDEKNLHKDSLNRTILCEKIMDRFMVKHYADKLFNGEFASFMLESCIKLFVTVRGHAWARKRKSEDKNQGNSNNKALRKSLMEYTKT
ncbi:uncharacterized protein LOC123532516 [Mercenaria mercenaria]|uniref:uncharacterized protein LOC123532516 n=1 Tax=Mercenaria mercenaria TaxID=6596 RepID=UPI00234F0663|nr:uncharacterized protein LOC123532516 [Mercenaria mercenaria]XP_053381195.1 uncharacterized protein LOC123532516 [Mercenaria mercenaria]XP_053381196.1 uncharacterized protein LOC123532516 [Mercenaria mercenaria]XP_053381197.1 uncharacterized protein LOC123532516 [Mercenaria mercenaria]